MSGRVKSAGWLVVAAMVLGVLSLGAREAFASSRTMACPNDGFNTLGYQPSYAACNSACFTAHPLGDFHASWAPTTGCCKCLL